MPRANGSSPLTPQHPTIDFRSAATDQRRQHPAVVKPATATATQQQPSVPTKQAPPQSQLGVASDDTAKEAVSPLRMSDRFNGGRRTSSYQKLCAKFAENQRAEAQGAPPQPLQFKLNTDEENKRTSKRHDDNVKLNVETIDGSSTALRLQHPPRQAGLSSHAPTKAAADKNNHLLGGALDHHPCIKPATPSSQQSSDECPEGWEKERYGHRWRHHGMRHE